MTIASLRAAVIAGVAGIAVSPASADQPPRLLSNPPTLRIARPAPAPAPAMLRELASEAGRGEAVLDLSVEYREGTIFNPATGRADKVRLRSYTGVSSTSSPLFVGCGCGTRRRTSGCR
jgi:hypothetical protein